MAVGCFNQPSMLPGEDKISLWGTGNSPSPPNSSSLFHSCWSPIPNASESLPSPWHSVYSWISGTGQVSLHIYTIFHMVIENALKVYILKSMG